MIFFRCDSSNKIGTGHVVRCLTLAKALKKKKLDCVFICRDHKDNLINKIIQEGFEVEIISNTNNSNESNDYSLKHADWLEASWQDDVNETLKIIKNKEIEWIIVDHYGLDKRWETKIRPYAKKIMVIDDLADRKHHCDLLLDQNLVKNYEIRYQNLIPKNCISLLGPKYALLQKDYGKMHKNINLVSKEIKRILIFFGGIDKHSLTKLILLELLKIKNIDIKIDVVIDFKQQYSSEIISISKKHDNVLTHNMMPSLAPLMIKSDLVIGASGATTWERCCLGLPSLMVVTGFNQEKIAETMEKIGAAIVFKINNMLEIEIRNAVLFLINNRKSYLKMSKKAF